MSLGQNELLLNSNRSAARSAVLPFLSNIPLVNLLDSPHYPLRISSNLGEKSQNRNTPFSRQTDHFRNRCGCHPDLKESLFQGERKQQF